jgi:hypothetical protein
LLAESQTQPSLIELRAEEQWLDRLRDDYRADYELGATLGFDETIELALSAR